LAFLHAKKPRIAGLQELMYLLGMQIDHEPNERRQTNTIWWVLWPILALQWIATGYFWGFDWHQLALGGFTGLVLATWAIEVTGNKVPRWMKGSPPRRDRNL
jgi:hypothetical protein